MKCKRCHRELKNHTESGMGQICRMKANRANDIDNAKTNLRVEPLTVGYRARRSYLVFTKPRQRVVVTDHTSGRFAECGCNSGRCQHIEAVAAFDNSRFPQETVLA